MNSFILALQFLTIIPVDKRVELREKEFSQALVYFPVVGLILGLLLSAMALILLVRLDSFVVSCLIVTLLAVITGGLHLDGLADTFDALGSRKAKDEMLSIMRDSHIGTMGVVSLISVMLLKVGLLNALPCPQKIFALIMMCVASRFAMVAAMFLFPYAREHGKAKLFIDGANKKIFLIVLSIAALFVFIAGFWLGLLYMLVTVLVVCGFCRYITVKIGGITGDVVGAVCELSEVLFLLLVALWGK